MKNIIDHLDKLFKKDETLQNYQAIEAFETYCRPGFSDSVKTENGNQTEHKSKFQDTLPTRGCERSASRGKYSRSHGQYSYQPCGQSSKGAVSRSVTTSARWGRNPSDGQENPTKCSVCESVNHWAQDRPDKVKDEHDMYYSYHVVLFQ